MDINLVLPKDTQTYIDKKTSELSTTVGSIRKSVFIIFAVGLAYKILFGRK